MPTDDMHARLARRIRAAIVYSGVTAPELRDRMAKHGADLSLNYVYRIASGDASNPRYNTLVALIESLELPAGWFLSSDVGDDDAAGLARYIEREGGRY